MSATVTTPNEIVAETMRQIRTLAPAKIDFEGKSYRFTSYLFDNDSNTVRVDYNRRERGAFLASKVVFSIRYDSASDLYTITSEHFDGKTFDSRWIRTTEGATFDAFERIALFAVPLAD